MESRRTISSIRFLIALQQPRMSFSEMPDSKEYLHPEAIRRISRMELRAHHVVEGFLSGMHRSPYFGQSIEFVQHRQYVPGDDLRHIDWKVWGRQDRLYIKQYEEDTNLRCTFLVDASESMSYGRGPLNKFDYAATVAACLAYLVIKQQDAAGLVVFDDQIRTRLGWRSSRKHLNAIFDSLQKVQPAQKTDLAGVFREVNDSYPKRGLMVVLSDFLGVESSAMKAWQPCDRRATTSWCSTSWMMMNSTFRSTTQLDSKAWNRSTPWLATQELCGKDTCKQ